ncbi:hypothetical protein ACIBIZ_26250 [Nonomuraea spiralis]|uniref:hypothetical protein n=1 Tax=Nonomuraea TaxID=83681 RepID=UPI00163BAF08|nr:hypothetical protein [Nonomuraea sp. WAC 01424]
MKASPVIQAGSDRPDRKKSRLLETLRRAATQNQQDHGEVDEDQRVVDDPGTDPARVVYRDSPG